jgi:hypothetical protein
VQCVLLNADRISRLHENWVLLSGPDFGRAVNDELKENGLRVCLRTPVVPGQIASNLHRIFRSSLVSRITSGLLVICIGLGRNRRWCSPGLSVRGEDAGQ